MSEWRDRVIERRRVRIGDIRVNKWNPRSHPRIQQERLRATLDKFGIIGDLIAFKDDDGEWTLFDGHARQKLDPDQEWMVSFTSLTRKEVDELVLLFDPLAALARQEADKTMALMAGLEVQERALKEMLAEQAQALGFKFATGNADWNGAMGGLPDGDRSPFQQMTFTLHDEQVEQVQAALRLSKAAGAFDSQNENSNGNALARICETYLTLVGDGQS